MRAVCLGLTTVDLIQRVARLPRRDEKIAALSARLDLGGPAANAATVAAGLGVETTLVTAVGRGPMADVARAGLEAAGVEVVDLATGRYGAPVSSVLQIEGRPERSVVSVNAASLEPAPLPEAVLDGAGALLVDGHIMERAIELAGAARGRAIPVVMDGGSWKPGTQELLALVDVAIVSADFDFGKAKHDAGTLASAKAILDRVAEAGPRWAAMSRGPRPALFRWPDGTFEEFPVGEASLVLDTLGAGDVLHGAALTGIVLQDEKPLNDVAVRAAFEAAMAAASVSVMAPGPRNWLRRHGTGERWRELLDDLRAGTLE